MNDFTLKHIQGLVDDVNAAQGDLPERVMQAFVVTVNYGADGTKMLRAYRSQDLRTWEALGMMEHMKNELASSTLIEWLEE